MLRNNLFFFIPIIITGFSLGYFLPSVYADQIPFTFIEQTDEQTHTGDFVWTDIPGATIDSGNFTTGRKYLILTSVWFDSGSSGNNAALVVQHGSTNFTESFTSLESANSPRQYKITWFTVWTAVASEGIKMQQRLYENSGATVRSDQIKLLAIELSEELNEGTDWTFSHDSSSRSLDTTFTIRPMIARFIRNPTIRIITLCKTICAC